MPIGIWPGRRRSVGSSGRGTGGEAITEARIAAQDFGMGGWFSLTPSSPGGRGGRSRPRDLWSLRKGCAAYVKLCTLVCRSRYGVSDGSEY